MANLYIYIYIYFWYRLKKSEGSMQSWDQSYPMPVPCLKLVKNEFSMTLVCLQLCAIFCATR